MKQLKLNMEKKKKKRKSYNLGNDYNLKFKTSKDRKELCDKWCDHLINGYSKSSFPYCDDETFKSYVKKYPDDFASDKIEKAERISKMFWEGLGIDGTIGNIDGFNSSSWKFNMVNRFGWKEKTDLTTKDKEIQPLLVEFIDDKNTNSN